VEGTWFSEQGMLPKLLSSIRVGDVFLDAGANLGMFSVFVAERVGPNGLVFAFEPESVAHERLLENIRINKLTNVRPFKMALSQESGNRHLAIGDPEGVSQSSHLSDEGFGFEVESADFDSFAAKNNLPIPQVVKMDIEGHEYAALQGMKKTLANPACRSIFCEVHPCVLPRGVMAKDVAALIRSFGFHSLSVDERFEQFHISATKT
jgi:FkbM family methyltransferase